jgi:hypothetical protein
VASGAPKPAGTKRSVCEFGCDHLPSTSGESFGFSEPRIFFTGLEKVISIGVEAEIVEPAIGEAAIVGLPVAGNQVTDLNLPTCSIFFDHGAPATIICPAGGCSPREKLSRGWAKWRCFSSPGCP